MSLKVMIITDILEFDTINSETPIIIIKNIPITYLLKIENNIYWVDTNKLYKELGDTIPFINIFIPVGQIRTNNTHFTTILANTNIIPYTQTYEKIKNNEWVAIIRKNDKINKSLGTFRSIDKPTINIPVFPKKFLQKYTNTTYNNNTYNDLYSNKSYGRWVLNKYMFNMDKSNIKMIDSAGKISNMYIPHHNIDSYYNNDGKLESANKNSNMFPMTQDNIFIDNESTMDNYSIMSNSSVNRPVLILREKENPWFLDFDIVGEAVNTQEPHKVTGLSSISSELNDNNNDTTVDDIYSQNNIILFIAFLLILLFSLSKIFKK